YITRDARLLLGDLFANARRLRIANRGIREIRARNLDGTLRGFEPAARGRHNRLLRSSGALSLASLALRYRTVLREPRICVSVVKGELEGGFLPREFRFRSRKLGLRLMHAAFRVYGRLFGLQL